MLTLLRLVIMPFALRAMRRRETSRQAIALLGAAMFTDAVDGPIARARGEVSSLGKLLDPIADKLLIDGTAVTLSRYRGFPRWITALFILRDVVIFGGGMLIYRRKSEIVTAHPAGKLTTVALTGAMLLYIADGPRSGKPALYASLLPFCASFVAYVRSYARHMSGKDEG